VTPARAFAVFVDEIDRWWPRDYTWARETLERIAIEARADGACFELDRNGNRAVWGTVLTLHRPEHIVIAWQIRADRSAEPNPSAASRVDVRFAAAGDDLTEVVVVHRDFPRHGEGWRDYRRRMAAPEGWPRLITLYAEACGA
jgi:uncharacterized protein YndB with AHSA1/START domain